MPIHTAADIHRLHRGGSATAQPVLNEADYRAAHQQYMHALGKRVVRSLQRPAVYVNGWKWCIVCVGPDCHNRPAYGWGTACCFDCGLFYEDLTLPADAAAIERLLAFRPQFSQRSWLPTETLDDLRGENASLGVPS